MDIRCPSCKKLFRVADEKIAGKGIRFKCSKCAEIITITKDDFEIDLLARGAEATVPVPQQPPKPATRPSPPTAPEPSIKPVPSQPIPSPAPEAREYQPPQEHDIPSAALNDFDFSEPHAAAAAAAHPGEGFGGQDFSFKVEPEPEQEAVSEVEISPAVAAEAEAALQFPDDLISEPTRKPVFGMSSASEPPADEEPGQEPEPQPKPKPETKPEPNVFQGEMPKTGPVFTPPRPKAALEVHAEEEIDLGAALRIPQDFSSDEKSSGDSRASNSFASSTGGEIGQPGASAEIHPFASGNATGAVAGLGCALPLVAVMTLGVGMMAKFLPLYAGLPLWHLAAIAGMVVVSMGVMIGIMISLVQARAGKKLFFLVNIFIGTVFGAGFGAAESVIKSLVTGTGPNIPQIIAGSIAMGSFAFVLSLLVVIARRVLVITKEETFSATLSGLQKAGLAVSLAIFLAAVYAVGTFAGKLEQSVKESQQQPAHASRNMLVSPEGLQVNNAHGYFDPATGDLVITGSVQNTTDKPKAGWYLVTEVRDVKETVLATVRMVNGIQIYSKAEHELLAKRGGKIEELQKKMASLRETMIAPKGSIPFEVRFMNPPAGSAGFLPTLRAFDLATMGEVAQEGMGRK